MLENELHWERWVQPMGAAPWLFIPGMFLSKIYRNEQNCDLTQLLHALPTHLPSPLFLATWMNFPHSESYVKRLMHLLSLMRFLFGIIVEYSFCVLLKNHFHVSIYGYIGSLQFGATMNNTNTNTITVYITIDVVLVMFDFFFKVTAAWFIWYFSFSTQYLPTSVNYLLC